MTPEQIAFQLVSVSRDIQTPQGLREACRRVADLGYRAVQVSGIYDAPLTTTEIRSACEDAGLRICATHEKWDLLLDAPEQAAARLLEIGTRLTAYPYPSGFELSDPAQLEQLIARLTAAGRVFADRGLTLCYHNHTVEFQRIGGTTVLEKIYDSIPADLLQAELDTMWIQLGGQSPEAWCRRMQGRLPILHVTDFAIDTAKQPVPTAVGAGNLPLPAILQAAEEAGCEWFVVELYKYPADPYEAAARSLDYLHSLTHLPALP